MTLNRVNLSFVGEAKDSQARVDANILCMILLPTGLGSFSEMPPAQDTGSRFLILLLLRVFSRVCPHLHVSVLMELGCILRDSHL